MPTAPARSAPPASATASDPNRTTDRARRQRGPNYREAWRANDLVRAGKVPSTLSEVYRLEDIGEATGRVHCGQHVGKVGDFQGLGIDDPDRRWSMRTDRMSIVRSYAWPGAS